MGSGERIPTLDSVLQLVAGRMYVNIEVKAPHDRPLRELYDFKESVRLVHELSVRHNI